MEPRLCITSRVDAQRLQGALPQKVMSRISFGFAAGCEAVAMPRRTWPSTFLGYALVRPVAQYTEGLSPSDGHSPGII
ncbi:MAG: hypothetical protein ABR568_17015 [Pyrinomonadaceae bacterium]